MSGSRSSTPVVSVIGVSKTYPGVRALTDVGFEAFGGEIVGLLGKNGAGKSTLIKILAGLERPDSGVILVEGVERPHYSARDVKESGFHFVFQELEEFRDMSVAENILIGSGLPRRAGVFVSDRRMRHRAAEYLARIDCVVDPAARMGDLSTVERRQVMVARALAGNVRLLVLDEPTASLSPREVDEVLRLARAMRDAGAAVIYVSHRLDEVLALVDRVVVLRDGRNVIDEPRERVDLPFLVASISGRQRFAGGFAEVAEVTEAPGRTPVPRDSEPVLSVSDISDGRKFEGISFDVHAGEVLGLGGLVGAGRTEVVSALVGDRPIVAGTISWRGAPSSFSSPGAALKAGIVLLPEERRSQGLIAEYGVRENATLSTLSRYHWIPPISLMSVRRERAAVTPLVHALRIKTSGLDTPVRTLSGGTQQKVVTARALLSDASLIIMDEPTAGIDVDAKEEIYELIEELKTEGKAIIVICSEFAELERLSDRVVVLSSGRQAGTLEGEEVHEEDITRLCYLDMTPAGGAR